MKTMSPEEAKLRGFDQLTAVKVGVPVEQHLRSDIEGVSDEEYAQKITQMLDDQLDEGWEVIREEAVEALRANPDDEHAKDSLLMYEQRRRQQMVPEKVKAMKSGLVLSKPGRKVTLSKSGVWTRDKRHGWVIKASGNCQTGDVIKIRKKGGMTEEIRLGKRIYDGVSLFFGGAL